MSYEPPSSRAPTHEDSGRPMHSMSVPTAGGESPVSRAASDFMERTFAAQQAPLTRYAARLLGDPDRARDVVQDTFVKLMAQPLAAVDGHAVEWLFTVCRHRALDVLRKEGRMKRFADGEAEQLTASGPRPGHALEQAETQAALLRLIGHLPSNQQEVVRLKFQNGFSYKEIARITELSVGNVGFLIHTAVARLRTEFAAQRP
jgi:RNA polymerase sigma factor (sigma-70 family)